MLVVRANTPRPVVHYRYNHTVLVARASAVAGWVGIVVFVCLCTGIVATFTALALRPARQSDCHVPALPLALTLGLLALAASTYLSTTIVFQIHL